MIGNGSEKYLAGYDLILHEWRNDGQAVYQVLSEIEQCNVWVTAAGWKKTRPTIDLTLNIDLMWVRIGRGFGGVDEFAWSHFGSLMLMLWPDMGCGTSACGVVDSVSSSVYGRRGC